MDQFSKVLLAIDKIHTEPQRALDCVPGLGGLNQVYVDGQGQGQGHKNLDVLIY